MFAFMQERKRRYGIARLLYDAILRQARQPIFYQEKGVPDTVTGRFELVVLHAFIVWRRLDAAGEEGAALAQALFDVMFRDMSDALRNIGIGDLGVPHHIKRMMRGYKGRAMAYRDALDSAGGDAAAIEKALRRNLFATVSEPDQAHLRFFKDYIMHMADILEDQRADAILDGKIRWEQETNEAQQEGKRSGIRMVA